MYEITLAVLCVCTLGCAGANTTAHGPDNQDPRESKPHVVTAAPTTIAIDLDEPTRQELTRRLTDGSLRVARLRLGDITPRSADTLKGVRLFVEKPDATLTTPVDDPHYATSFVRGFSPPDTALLNLAPTLLRLWRSGTLTSDRLEKTKALRITFVPEPSDAIPVLPADFALTIQAIALDIPRQP
jgi:hypothetical protein